MTIKIVLAPTIELARTVEGVTASVEAEYGDHIVKGELITLAHHVKEYADHPAPCNNNNVPVLPEGSTILVSHIDLDTLGGIMALMGNKPNDNGFWQAAEFIDLNGLHHGYKFPSELPKIHAFLAWNASQVRPRITELTDVTESVQKEIDVLSQILNGDQSMIEAGQKWAEEVTQKIDGCLLQEDARVRVFVTDDVFCAASYYSEKLGKIIPATVTLNTKSGSITVATCNSAFNAKELVQGLWGSEAGGHAGIAGSPRGMKKTLYDLVDAVESVQNIIREAKLDFIEEKNEVNGKNPLFQIGDSVNMCGSKLALYDHLEFKIESVQKTFRATLANGKFDPDGLVIMEETIPLIQLPYEFKDDVLVIHNPTKTYKFDMYAYSLSADNLGHLVLAIESQLESC